MHTHKLGFVWDVCVIPYVIYYFQNTHHFTNLCLCCLTWFFLCSAEMSLLLLLNLFWIDTKRRSGFFRQTCQCFQLYALSQICIDLRSSSLHHGYATVIHSCDFIKIQKDTYFLREVHKGFPMYLQKMLSRALLSVCRAL